MFLDPKRKYSSSDFEFKKELGEGSYSVVYLAHLINTQENLLTSSTKDDINQNKDRKTNQDELLEGKPGSPKDSFPFAIKVLNKKHIIKHNKIKYVTVEKDVLLSLNHPNIVKLYATFQDASNLYFVLEYVSNGDLYKLMKFFGRLNAETIRFFGSQLVMATEYLHARNIIHRDLKPENILVDEKLRLKITDFGTAKIMSCKDHKSIERQQDDREDTNGRKNSFVGTAEYCSPELLTDREASFMSDVWALGCIFFQMSNGKVPFKGGNNYQTFQLITKGEYTFEEGVDKQLMDLIDSMLILDAKKRLGIEGIKSHSLFRNFEWEIRSFGKCPLLKDGEETLLIADEENTTDDEFESALLGLPDLSFGPVKLRGSIN